MSQNSIACSATLDALGTAAVISEASLTIIVPVAVARTGPSYEHSSTRQLNCGAVFSVISQTGNGQNLWYLIRLGDEEVWINIRDIQLNSNQVLIPTTQNIP
jgi:hypothetical protein